MRTRSSFPALSRSHTARATRMWQEARYVVQVSRHQQQTMTLTRPGHSHGHHGVHEKLQIPARAHRCAGVPPAGEMGHSGRPRWGQGAPPTMAGGTPFRSTFLLRSLCCSLLRQKSPRFKAGAGCCCGGGFYRCWRWWAEHTARLRANIHSVSALLPGACVPSCCT